MRPLTCSLCLFLALPLALPAQAPESETTLRTTTSEVMLDVVVRDKHGNIVHNLRPNEVQVLEDGVPQKLRQFDFINGRSEAPVTPLLPPPPSAPSSASSSAEPMSVNQLRDISVVSVVIANLDPRGRKLAVDAMREFIKTQLRPDTYVGVFEMGFGMLRVAQTYTNNAAKITAAMSRISHDAMISQMTGSTQLSLPDTDFGQALNGDAATAADPNGPDGPAPIDSGLGGVAAELAQMMDTTWVNEMQDVYTEGVNFLTPLHTFVEAQGKIPGRKVVLLFSAGMPVSSVSVEELNSVMSVANRNNVSIYAVDTRGVTTYSHLDNARRSLQAATAASRQQMLAKLSGGDEIVTPSEAMSLEMSEDSLHANTNGNLAELAEGTGGALLPDSLDLMAPLQRALEDVRTHYELAYAPSNTALDGGFRKIEVRVSRPGVKVFARSGYYAVPQLDGHEVYPFEIATLKAINTRPILHEFDFRASALQFRPSEARTQLSFVFQAPTQHLTIEKDGRWARVHVCVTALVRNQQGQVVDKISKDIPYEVPAAREAELEKGVVSFTTPFRLAPGVYTLETAAVDRQSMKASVKRSALVVTDGPGFSMSDVTVARRIDPIDGPSDVGDPLEARGGKVTPELSNALPPDANGKLKLYAVAYPPAPIDAPVDASIELWRNGQLVLKSAASVVPPDASGAASILANLDTGKLPAGQYQAQISFEYKGKKLSKAVPFTLGSGS